MNQMTGRFLLPYLLCMVALGLSCTKNYYTIVQPPEHEPQLLWVPDEYETIQDAIWESEDGDTIMVRAGTYYEQLQFFDKNVSLVSESGPEETIIDGTGYTYAAWISGGQDTLMIVRGFTFTNRGAPGDTWWNGILLGSGASPKIVNNIFIAPVRSGIVSGQTYAQIRNNLFINNYTAVQIALSWGDFINNMIIHTEDIAFWDAAGAGQPLVPDYNLIWEYGLRDRDSDMIWGENNIFDISPIFVLGSYRLEDGSPGQNQGYPFLIDLDGTRSDIGVYGGPHTYP